jgi:hypothetical protein
MILKILHGGKLTQEFRRGLCNLMLNKEEKSE